MKFKLQNPFNATKLDATSVISGLSWVVFVVAILAGGQTIARWVGMKTPIDTTISGSRSFGDPTPVVGSGIQDV